MVVSLTFTTCSITFSSHSRSSARPRAAPRAGVVPLGDVLHVAQPVVDEPERALLSAADTPPQP